MSQKQDTQDAAVLDDIVELSAVCKKYFGITPRIAQRKAASDDLPIKAFRLSGVRRGPLFVRKADLEKLVPKPDDAL